MVSALFSELVSKCSHDTIKPCVTVLKSPPVRESSEPAQMSSRFQIRSVSQSCDTVKIPLPNPHLGTEGFHRFNVMHFVFILSTLSTSMPSFQDRLCNIGLLLPYARFSNSDHIVQCRLVGGSGKLKYSLASLRFIGNCKMPRVCEWQILHGGGKGS